MRIVLLIQPNHAYCNLVARRLLKEFGSQIGIIIESQVLLAGKSFFQSILRYVKIAGWRYFGGQASRQVLFKWSRCLAQLRKDETSAFYPYQPYARAAGTRIFGCKNINEETWRSRLREYQPDLILSAFFNQILRSEVLQIAKQAWNLHPALLPRYRGVSPIFWALAHGERHVGITLHRMAPRVDEGDVISQESVPVRAEDTEHSLYLECAARGAELIIKAIRNFDSVHATKQDVSQASSFGIPTRRAVSRFYASGRRLYRLGDFV